jgi:hypothetical protein
MRQPNPTLPFQIPIVSFPQAILAPLVLRARLYRVKSKLKPREIVWPGGKAARWAGKKQLVSRKRYALVAFTQILLCQPIRGKTRTDTYLAFMNCDIECCKSFDLNSGDFT